MKQLHVDVKSILLDGNAPTLSAPPTTITKKHKQPHQSPPPPSNNTSPNAGRSSSPTTPGSATGSPTTTQRPQHPAQQQQQQQAQPQNQQSPPQPSNDPRKQQQAAGQRGAAPPQQPQGRPVQTASPDDKECKACGKEFGVFLRKHRCRVCNVHFCDKCSPPRVILSYLSVKEFQRTCLECFKALSHEYADKKTLAGRKVNVSWPFNSTPKCRICLSELKSERERVLCCNCRNCLCVKCCQPRLMIESLSKTWFQLCNFCTPKLMEEYAQKGTVAGRQVSTVRNRVFNAKTCSQWTFPD
eukprot:TRINITY_DN61919_c0_g5_i1.p2 TRINITY_DN61919_c0_g5~~TRINITY_DN61919_c0_g5_i1.p2  ORF type:complete len:316 (+),score=52.84 TRINITY_DN61919_c0_g5_i1:53-949(+)